MESSNQTGSSNASSSTNDQQEMLIHGLFLSTYQVDRWESEGFFIKADLVDGWIDLHWMKFEPVKQSVHLALAIIYVLFFLVGSSSNALVLYIILRYIHSSFPLLPLFERSVIITRFVKALRDYGHQPTFSSSTWRSATFSSLLRYDVIMIITHFGMRRHSYSCIGTNVCF